MKRFQMMMMMKKGANSKEMKDLSFENMVVCLEQVLPVAWITIIFSCTWMNPDKVGLVGHSGILPRALSPPFLLPLPLASFPPPIPSCSFRPSLYTIPEYTIIVISGSISRLMREHAHPGAIFTSTAFRGGLFAGLRSNPTSTTTNPSAELNVEHPLLRRQQSSERPHQTSSSRISRVHLLRSDRNRSGHMTHVHVHYSHPHGMLKPGTN